MIIDPQEKDNQDKPFYRLIRLKQRMNGFTILCEEPSDYSQLPRNKMFVAHTWEELFNIIIRESGKLFNPVIMTPAMGWYNLAGFDSELNPTESKPLSEYLVNGSWLKFPTQGFSDSFESNRNIFIDSFENGWLVRFKVKRTNEDTEGYWFEFVATSWEEKEELIKIFKSGQLTKQLIEEKIPLALPFDDKEDEEDDY